MYICNNCGNEFIKWQGQCTFCREWNTIKEFKETKEEKGKIAGEKKILSKVSLEKKEAKKFLTSSSELNNVLGWGIIPGSLILLSGEPGIGKSTLALQIASWLSGENVIYISAEETAEQIFGRAERLGANSSNVSILSESNLENIFSTLVGESPTLLILDSISVIHSYNTSGSSGSINQVKYIGEMFQDYAKKNNISVIIIGHITKDGSVAGPKSLEHLVDTILYFEWERYEDIRILRALKNRFGGSWEVGIFKMTEKWLLDLKNPWVELLSSKNFEPAIGSSLSMTIEGSRPVLVECEALTNYTKFGYPKRSTRGINSSKLDMLIAILWKYSEVKLESYDVYANIARGLRIDEPGIDLSILASIISSKTGKYIPKDIAFMWEVSLTGKVKGIIHLEKRVKEAEKLGLKKVVIPDEEVKSGSTIELVKIKDIKGLTAFISSL